METESQVTPPAEPITPAEPTPPAEPITPPAELPVPPVEPPAEPAAPEVITLPSDLSTATPEQLAKVQEFFAGKQDAEFQDYAKAEVAKLQAEWGDKLTENADKAKAAAMRFGVNLQEYGDAALVKFFHTFHSLITEDPRARGVMGIPSGELGLVQKSQVDEARDIIHNPKNPLYERYHKGETAIVQQVENMFAGRGR